MDERAFRIRPYSKSELARKYFPETIRTKTAVANLRNLMMRNDMMMRELTAAGYRSHNRMLTPLQVGIMVYYLGEP